MAIPLIKTLLLLYLEWHYFFLNKLLFTVKNVNKLFF